MFIIIIMYIMMYNYTHFWRNIKYQKPVIHTHSVKLYIWTKAGHGTEKTEYNNNSNIILYNRPWL